MNSHRQIFRSSAIIGGASFINIAFGIIRVKVLAVLLGPAGVGVMGLYQSILNTASTMAGAGLAGSGVRQLAVNQGDEVTQAIVRRALFWLSILLGLLGGVILWLIREPVAILIFEDAMQAKDVGWLGIGVFLSVLAASYTAFLQGLRRIGDVARVNVVSSFVGSVVGISSILWLGYEGISLFVIAPPLSTFVFAAWYASRIHQKQAPHDWPSMYHQSQIMLALGIPLMAAGLLTLFSQLFARTLVIRELGLDAGGYFQAAWAISMTYLSFVLTAMGADYLPRLTEVIHDKKRAIQAVNEQTEMALLLAGPVLLAMLTLSPFIIELLYAESFAPAAEILRWQVMGDILKVLGWPMGFIVLAQGRGGIFILTQFNWNMIYLLILWFGVEELGLISAGIAFFVAYLIQVILVRAIVGKLIGYFVSPTNLYLFLALSVFAVMIFVMSIYSFNLSYLLGMVLTVIISAYSILRLNQLLDLGWSVKGFLGRFKQP